MRLLEALALIPDGRRPVLVLPGYPTEWEAELRRKAHDLGLDGIVCSAEESSALHLMVGSDMVLVTPGIRPSGGDHADQKRVVTPANAIAAGADYLVVGRPIMASPDPAAVAAAIIADIAKAAG